MARFFFGTFNHEKRFDLAAAQELLCLIKMRQDKIQPGRASPAHQSVNRRRGFSRLPPCLPDEYEI